LQDANKPAAPVNARAQIIAFGKPDAVEPKPAGPAAAKKGAAPAKKKH
jgi:OmpA-OmpF porin, OOP family